MTVQPPHSHPPVPLQPQAAPPNTPAQKNDHDGDDGGQSKAAAPLGAGRIVDRDA